MNPLSLPKWNEKSLQETGLSKPTAPKARTPNTVRFTFQGLSGVPSRSVELPFDSSQNIGGYLASLNLVNVATKATIYDLANLEKGRVKLRYVPMVTSDITIGPPGYSPVSHLQRSSHDAQNLAKRMKTQEASLVYASTTAPSSKPSRGDDEFEQW